MYLCPCKHRERRKPAFTTNDIRKTPQGRFPLHSPVPLSKKQTGLWFFLCLAAKIIKITQIAMKRVQITSGVYEKLAKDLEEKIGQSDYVNGKIDFENDDFCGTLSVIAVIYRGTEIAPDYVSHPIVDIVPIWWQFDTITEDGECMNDFDFEQLKKLVA